MSSHFPARRSLRLHGYDYAKAGAYFITICTIGRAQLFGHVVQGQAVLSPLGVLVAEEWQRTPTVRPNIDLDAFVVMPDHLHGIVIVRERDLDASPVPQPGELTPTARTIGALVRGFKGAVTRQACQQVWQRNYHDHIIRDAQALERLRRYIEENPACWEQRRTRRDDLDGGR